MSRAVAPHFLGPLLLMLWLAALWTCMSQPPVPGAHHADVGCATIHHVVGLRAIKNIGTTLVRLAHTAVPAAVILIVVTWIATIIIPSALTPVMRTRRLYRRAQQNAPPAF
ncbi:MAG: hypothetical protein ACYCXG_03340 [Acidiferrobacter sp.]